MRRLDWDSSRRRQQGKETARNSSTRLPPLSERPTEKQLSYLAALLEKRGRRPFTAQEIAGLTKPGVSRLIEQLRDQAG